MDLRQFGRKMRVTGELVEKNTEKLVRKVALAVDASVVLATPVDTGRARANWQVEINNAADGTLNEPSDPGSGARQAIEDGKKTVEQYKIGDTIHITNNLPYIARLNEGWSAQAPANFVEEAAMAGVKQIKGAKITIEGGVE